MNKYIKIKTKDEGYMIINTDFIQSIYSVNEFTRIELDHKFVDVDCHINDIEDKLIDLGCKGIQI